MIVSGSSSRQTELTENKPLDTAIIAIIDYIDLGSKRIYSKEKRQQKEGVMIHAFQRAD